MINVLVTGGCGYIGSHVCVELLNDGYNVIVIDNLFNSSKVSLDRIAEITGRKPDFFEIDVRDPIELDQFFSEQQIDTVIHFAALKAVGESVEKPIEYYQSNFVGSLNLLNVMRAHGVNDFIFSSSATVYGESAPIPYRESTPVGRPSSPYGASKVMVERLLEDLEKSDPTFRSVSLRYFNPIGAHPSGLIGEDPNGIPNNLMPFITQVAIGKRECLNIFGDDYPTEDGTCRRDYLHVVDLAKGHVAALKWLVSRPDFSGKEAFNLGTGTPISVLGIVNAFYSVNNVKIPYTISARRDGDLPEFWADCTKANQELAWETQYDLNGMMRDSWNWQKKNPKGYGE